MRFTTNDCACRQVWSIGGAPCLHYCCNPDHYPDGDWCLVEDLSCEGINWGLCKNITGSQPKVSSTGRSSSSSTTRTPLLPVFTSFSLSGACDTVGALNGQYEYGGSTASGAPFYKSVSGKLFVYYDPDCNAGGAMSRWVVDQDAPNTTVTQDLDSDGQCAYIARKLSDDMSGPSTGFWRVRCGNLSSDQKLILTETLQSSTYGFSTTLGESTSLVTSSSTFVSTSKTLFVAFEHEENREEMPWLIIVVASAVVLIITCVCLYYAVTCCISPRIVRSAGDKGSAGCKSAVAATQPDKKSRDTSATEFVRTEDVSAQEFFRAGCLDEVIGPAYARRKEEAATGSSDEAVGPGYTHRKEEEQVRFESAAFSLEIQCPAEPYREEVGRQQACAVCLVRLRISEQVRRLACPARHVYHMSCIDCWFTRSARCPLCNFDNGSQFVTQSPRLSSLTRSSTSMLDECDRDLADIATDDSESAVSNAEWDPHSLDDSMLHVAVEVSLKDVLRQSPSIGAPGISTSGQLAPKDATPAAFAHSKPRQRACRQFDVKLRRDSTGVHWGIDFRVPTKSRCKTVLTVLTNSPAEAWQLSCVACGDLAHLLRRGDRLSMVNGAKDKLVIDHELAHSNTAVLTFRRLRRVAPASSEVATSTAPKVIGGGPWTCDACDEINRAERLKCNNCGGNRPAEFTRRAVF